MNNYKTNNCAYLYISGFFAPQQYDEILTQSKNCVQFAADALQKSILEGLTDQVLNLEVLNLPYLGAYPKNYRKLFSPDSIEYIHTTRNGKKSKIKNKRFLNIALLKHYFRYRACLKGIQDFCMRNKDKQCVIINYAITTSFLQAMHRIKKKYPNIITINIAPDLPEYMNDGNNTLIKLLKKFDKRLLDRSCSSVDGFVGLSKFMEERLCKQEQAFTVVEGIFNPSDDDTSEPDEHEDKKVIFYSGTLAYRYGIMNLVNAVKNSSMTDIVLKIAGDGGAKQEIIQLSQNDDRIKYLGQLARPEILKIQRNADLLVNPRTSEGEFTKYSFPSKTMEYLASGTPTIIYRLPGIPLEYFEYCYTPEDESVKALTETIEEVLNLEEEVRCSKGRRAREFILAKKNPTSQCKKIVELVNNIIKKKL